MRELMVRDAIREALDEEMARDSTVFQMGEDIGVIGGNFKCTVGLRDKYGDLRVKDTPISEQGFVGMGGGAALTGLRPVVELMFVLRAISARVAVPSAVITLRINERFACLSNFGRPFKVSMVRLLSWSMFCNILL